jgi:pimeloyl-ACP methyl ester carboxylesterase
MRRIQTLAATALTLALLAPTAAAADNELLLVHGYGDARKGKDCNGDTWKNALAYYQEAGGRGRSSMTTIGYYEGDERGECDVKLGDATNETPIQDIARRLAVHIDGRDEPVDIIAHSMGGLITRVALLGSAQGWDGFPSKLNVDNVVTLGTPHKGVIHQLAHDDRQWEQMRFPQSGFMKRLHEPGSGLGDEWASGTDWSLVGSKEDETVSYDSGIDKGNYADQKYGYQTGSPDGVVNHTGVRTLQGHDTYHLQYWHASGDHPPHTTKRGWSPLKAAFQAGTKIGDGLPR